MDFQSEKMLEKYVRLREEVVDPYVPDFAVADGTTRYVRFNDAWRGLNPYSMFLIPRLVNAKNVFPKKTSAKIATNANPDNYVTLRYDGSGTLRTARLGKYQNTEAAIVYVSKQLSISYSLSVPVSDKPSYELLDFEWREFDDAGRLIGVEEYQSRGVPSDDVIMNCEYYEYDGDVLSHAWCFQNFEKYPMQLTLDLVRQFMPDRIFNPDQTEYFFQPVTDGLDYTSKQYYRKSQTFTNEGHVSLETLSRLADQGIRLI